jgi:hypothetical protein
MAVPWLKRLVARFPSRKPGFPPEQRAGFVVDKAALEQIFSEYFDFPWQSFYYFFNHYNYPWPTQ